MNIELKELKERLESFQRDLRATVEEINRLDATKAALSNKAYEQSGAIKILQELLTPPVLIPEVVQ